ncbi:uncharacterized protein LOC135650192 isoform X2 [Musa acuminata AAA Group]|uniref:uncharacterized protein LOC135586151 isoform X2 n=1 Tax=Musa acuminata AAA Group TaxID=214697 RepID=UPI0031D5B21F
MRSLCVGRHRFLLRTPASLLPILRRRSRPSRAAAVMVTLVATTADPASVGSVSAFLAMPGWNPGPSVAAGMERFANGAVRLLKHHRGIVEEDDLDRRWEVATGEHVHLSSNIRTRQAARYDDLEDLVSILSVGISPNSRDSQGRTALHMAAANGHLEIVEYLIQNGADASMKQDLNALNSEKNSPLHWACLNGHIEVVKLLIQGGASVSLLNSHERTPMDEAVSRGKMDVINAINMTVAQLELDDVNIS